ncbi:MAG: ATP-binding protein, partial [Planctomycetes bacterium]|nr:ATP-binding protein [Planctomycetota bacterium]
MYIGRLGDGSNSDDGMYVLLKELVDNAVDEFIMGAGKKIEVRVKDGMARVRDYGRGIPLGKVIECVSVINTGAKYNDDVFQFSVGLNGVGTKAVNALSSYFRVVSYREGKYFEALFERGKLKKKSRGACPSRPDGTLVEFRPDEEIFGEYEFNMEFVERRMWTYACLNGGLKLVCNGKTFQAAGGLQDFLHGEVADTGLYDIAHFKARQLEFAFTHTANYGETYFSFVNGQYTNDGGTHQQAFREGLLKGINEFYRKNHHPADVRDGLIAAVSIKLKSPVFESQTKNKLGNVNIRGWLVNDVKAAVVDFLHKNAAAATVLSGKILQNERLRKELSAVKKEARNAAKRISIKIPQLKDCKRHLNDADGEKSTIFITEGASASGSIVSSRDAMNHAIFSLKGKPLNVCGKTRAAIYKNVELYNLM